MDPVLGSPCININSSAQRSTMAWRHGTKSTMRVEEEERLKSDWEEEEEEEGVGMRENG